MENENEEWCCPDCGGDEADWENFSCECYAGLPISDAEGRAERSQMYSGA